MSTFDLERLNGIPINEVAVKLGLQLHKNSCLCFIHKEKTPSFHIYPEKNIWKCFGCGEGGNVIKLVEMYNGYDFIESCKWLSKEFGIANYNVKRPIIRRKVVKINTEVDYKADSEVYKWFFDNLTVTEDVEKFIKGRKYPSNIIEQYNLKGLDDCKSFFEKCEKTWKTERLLKCGLAKEYIDEKTGEITYKFTWWTNTLFFPFYNKNKDIIYIQGRSLNSEWEKRCKYVNLNRVETVPFNLPVLNYLQKNDTLVITEGVTDCISCCLMGKTAIGIIGASGFKREYTKLIKDFDINVIPDQDESQAGEKFMNKIRTELAAVGKTINIINLLENCKDITEFYMDKWNHGKTN